MHLGNGRYLLAELPLEHLAIYSEDHPLSLYNKKGTACVCCGDVGVRLALTCNKGKGSVGVELYTEDWTIMTKDHMLARAKGGQNHIDNYQPMCRWCNSIKSDHDWTIEELRDVIRSRYKNLL